MPGCWGHGRGRGPRLQGRAASIGALGLCWLLGGCGDPLAAPVNLFHDLEGGVIADQRPPPPGAGQPYPKLGTVPPKPSMPDPAYRRSLQAQLQAERDVTERVAADTPITIIPPPPPAPPPPAPAGGALATANATLATADAPPPAAPPAHKPAAQPAAPPAASPAPVQAGPAAGAPLTIVGAPGEGAPPDLAGFPDVPAAPPPPAAFEGVPAEPAPTPRIITAALVSAPAGTKLYFATGDAVLQPSQVQALKAFLATRKHQAIEVIGLGEAASDTPDGQAAAIGLALQRAQAVARALAALHVPQGALRLGADAFGRGAVVRLLP